MGCVTFEHVEFITRKVTDWLLPKLQQSLPITVFEKYEFPLLAGLRQWYRALARRKPAVERGQVCLGYSNWKLTSTGSLWPTRAGRNFPSADVRLYDCFPEVRWTAPYPLLSFGFGWSS